MREKYRDFRENKNLRRGEKKKQVRLWQVLVALGNSNTIQIFCVGHILMLNSLWKKKTFPVYEATAKTRRQGGAR